MSKHISIHKAEFHHAYYVSSEENKELLDDILFVEKFIYPLEDKGYYYLYDVENEKLLSKSVDIESLKIDTDTEAVTLTGISFENISKILIPENTKQLLFEGGDLMPFEMSKTKQGDAVWKKVINHINHYKFVETIDERVLIEKELREIYNKEIPKCISGFGLRNLFQKVKVSNINDLTIGWTYFSDANLKGLSELEQLEQLSILYCYNDNIKWLPKNLTYLKVFGTTIQLLSEINLSKSKLITLDLEGNAISRLDNLLELPRDIEDLILSKNLIKTFNIAELPKNLKHLDLSNNLIDNDLFSQNIIHENLKFLILKENRLLITSSILHLILETFPNLEHLELLDNKTNGVPIEFLGDYEHKNCLEHVQIFLEEIDYQHNDIVLTVTDSQKLIHYIEVSWKEILLPLKMILSDVQYFFSKHFIKIPSFKQYINGLSCFITHDNCEIFITFDKENKQINFKIRSDASETVALYFHKYLQEINNVIAYNSHVNVLPFIKNSNSCNFLKDFCFKVFKLDYKVKTNAVLKKSIDNIDLLINNRTIEGDSEEGKFVGKHYENIENIAFVLVSGKSAYPFIINENGILTNGLNKHKDYYYYLTLRTALEKDNYIKGITSKYLNNLSLVEVEVFIDNNVKKKVSCFVNTYYFHADNKILSRANKEFPVLVEDYLKEVKMDNGKYCEFTIDNDLIELKYVI